MTIMNDLKFDRTVSAAFTGHRFYDFSQREFIQERAQLHKSVAI